MSDRRLGAIVALVLVAIAAVAWFWVGRGSDDPLVVPATSASSSSASSPPVGSAIEWSRGTVDGTHLQVRYGGSACQTSNDIRVTETEKRVVVTVYVVDSHRVCTLQLVGYDLSAELESPLDGRPVYDGACLEKAGDGCRRTVD